MIVSGSQADRLTHLLIEEQKSGFASDSSDPIKPDGVVEI
jgi:hypothetical protein